MAEVKVHSDVTGTAWKIVVSEGQTVEEGDELIIAEAMKMEIPHVEVQLNNNFQYFQFYSRYLWLINQYLPQHL